MIIKYLLILKKIKIRQNINKETWSQPKLNYAYSSMQEAGKDKNTTLCFKIGLL